MVPAPGWTRAGLIEHRRATARTLGFLAAWGVQQREVEAAHADRSEVAARLAAYLREQERITNELIAVTKGDAPTGEIATTRPRHKRSRRHVQ